MPVSFSKALLRPNAPTAAALPLGMALFSAVLSGCALMSISAALSGCEPETRFDRVSGDGGSVGGQGGGGNGIFMPGSGFASSRSSACQLLETASFCETESTFLEQTRPEIFFVMDTSGSMEEAQDGERRIDVTVKAVLDSLEEVGTRVSSGFIHFPGSLLLPIEPGDSPLAICDGDTPRLDEIENTLKNLEPWGLTPLADGLQEAIAVWYAEDQERDPDTSPPPRFVVVLTDGMPNGNAACVNGDGSVVGCSATDGAIQATGVLKAMGAKTYVVALPGSDAATSFLETLAEVGGTDDLAPDGFFDASESDDLVDALKAIAQDTFDCTVRLEETPTAASALNIYVDGELVPSDQKDGWKVISERELELVGDACDAARESTFGNVVVEYGCATVLR